MFIPDIGAGGAAHHTLVQIRPRRPVTFIGARNSVVANPVSEDDRVERMLDPVGRHDRASARSREARIGDDLNVRRIASGTSRWRSGLACSRAGSRDERFAGVKSPVSIIGCESARGEHPLGSRHPGGCFFLLNSEKRASLTPVDPTGDQARCRERQVCVNASFFDPA